MIENQLIINIENISCFTVIDKKPITICQEIDEKVFEYPFFNEGIKETTVAKNKTFNLESIELDITHKELELKGMIFHTSFCGSTMLSRMFNQIKKVRVVSEPEAINGLLLSYVLYDLAEDEIIDQLKKIIKLYQQSSIEEKKILVIKLTSWNVFFVKIFQKAYPTVKWLYIDRETEALINSLLNATGGFIDWWYHPVDILRKYFVSESLENKKDYLKKMVCNHRLYANQNINKNGLFIIYPDFLDKFSNEILPHFGIKATSTDRKNSAEIRKYDSKSMKKVFWNN